MNQVQIELGVDNLEVGAPINFARKGRALPGLSLCRGRFKRHVLAGQDAENHN